MAATATVETLPSQKNPILDMIVNKDPEMRSL